MLAKHVLYQLSYTPSMPGALPLNTPRPFRLSVFSHKNTRHGRSPAGDFYTENAGLVAGILVGPGRVELPTSTLSV